MRKILISVMMAAVFGLATPLPAQETMDSSQKVGGSKSLEERLKQLEDAIDREVEGDKWYDRIQISGLIEVEAAYQSVDVPDEAREETSDIDLATVELVVDARIVNHVDGHVMFTYEDDEVFVDEGFIALTGTESFPAYLIAGRQYVPFGYYDSFFVTDPNTLILGETNQGALVLGYRFGGEMVDLTIGAFNGSVDEIDTDDHIDGFVAGIFTQPFQGLMVGASYSSNLASSDTFSEFVDSPIEKLVGGWSAYLTYEFFDRFKLIGEYVGALDKFNAGELYDPADTANRQPEAWNVEFGAVIVENLELAVRYGGSVDGGAAFLPESQYGAVLNWGFFDSTNLALEYLHDDFEDDAREVDTLTAQLAVEF